MKHDRSLHEQILSDIQREIDSFPSMATLSPTVVASAVLKRMHERPLEAKIEYASLEHLKQIARGALGGRYDPDRGDASVAYQADMFTGHLQPRYPLPRKRGLDPQYKPLDALSSDEADWNVALLRKSGTARLRHADALQAWNEGRNPPGLAAA